MNVQIVSRSEAPPAEASYAMRPVVLVVDDERVIADTLSLILARSGFHAITAYDGESALDLAGVVPPELLLSDVMMGPGMDGAQLAMRVSEAVPDCKVLLFSGHASTRDLIDRHRQKGYEFKLLSKPLHPSDLLAHISESLPAHRIPTQQ